MTDTSTPATRTDTKVGALLVSALMVLAVFAGTIALGGTAAAAGGSTAGGPVASSSTTISCSTTVVYDEFREDDAMVSRLENGTNETVKKQLTKVTVGTDSGFYRVSAENPNGYCVRFVVEVHDDVFPPADLPGEVRSTNDKYVGNWSSVYDWDNETLYTRVTFTLPANSSATFAPSSARVFTLAWAMKEPQESKGFLEKQYEQLTDNETVEKKTHRIDASEIDRETPFPVVVPLEHPETGERLKDQELVYSTDGGDTWRPVTTRTTAPVYKTVVNNGSALQLTFNDKDVIVKFVANPNDLKRAQMGYDTWITGAYDTVDALIPGDYFTVTRKDAKNDGVEG